MGHAIHSIPAGANAETAGGSERSSLASTGANSTMQSSGARRRCFHSMPAGNGSSDLRNSGGAASSATRWPSLSPSFFASGVPL